MRFSGRIKPPSLTAKPIKCLDIRKSWGRIQRFSKNGTWYTQSAPNPSKEKGELVTAEIVKRLMKRLK